METIVIIGAGASGLACMNELVKTNKYNIIVLEQSNKAARKILASGNGSCNVSNLNMDIKYYNHQDPLIEKLIKELENLNMPKAEVRLNDIHGSTALFARYVNHI